MPTISRWRCSGPSISLFPVWQAGSKTFSSARCDAGRFIVGIWVGVDQQRLMTLDGRFRIPACLGHNGWIALDVTDHCDPDEVSPLALQSYRHFALQRMLRKLRV